MMARENIVPPLVAALKQHPQVLTVWEGGAIAFNRLDQWSDIDLAIICQDDFVEQCWTVIEDALKNIGTILLRYHIAQHHWQGFQQTFYTLKDVSPYLYLDVSVIAQSAPEKLLQPEIHGNPFVHFDSAGYTTPTAFDREANNLRIASRLETLKTTFPLYRVLTLKELNRGNTVEAINFYMGSTLRPLVELLRIRYAPDRFNFHSRYVQYDLPPDVVGQLHDLYFVRDAHDLRQKHARAEELFCQVLKELEA